MSTTVDRPTAEPATAKASRRGRWLDDWHPDDEEFWQTKGKRIARKNLVLSIFAEHLGFSIWVLWTIVVINLANAGFTLS
ncbi:MAG: transporter, family, nitrate/nitrite transporter, partial [Frankiaceae bacterium]|nr:transporter, family, nitrate/nitrite transporter [Frankiaceae bacterium]